MGMVDLLQVLIMKYKLQLGGIGIFPLLIAKTNYTIILKEYWKCNEDHYSKT